MDNCNDFVMLQKDFIEDWSPVALKAGKDIVPNVVKAVEIARERGMLIVWVIIPNLNNITKSINNIILE